MKRFRYLHEERLDTANRRFEWGRSGNRAHRDFIGEAGGLAVTCYCLEWIVQDPIYPPLAIGGLGASILFTLAYQLRYEDHERFRAGDFWRAAGLFTLTLCPWLALIPFWEVLSARPGVLLAFPVLAAGQVVGGVLASSGRRLRSVEARRRILSLAAGVWAFAAVVVGLGFGLRIYWAGLDGTALAAAAAATLLFTAACLLLAWRFWRVPPLPMRAGAAPGELELGRLDL